jgi:hypothetical protein
LDIDFRLDYPDSTNAFINKFPQWSMGIITVARLSRKNNIVDLLREYDLKQHCDEDKSREHLFALFSLLYLLPSSNTRQKGRVSAVELENSLLVFKPQQTNLDMFVK